MKPSSTKHKIDPSEKGVRQNFLRLGITKVHKFAKPTSKERSSISSTKKFKTHASVKNFGGSSGHSQISKVRVSSGGRVKPGASKYPEKKLKYLLHDTDKYKRKSGGGSHSRNQVYSMAGGSQTGRSYNKSNTREYSPNNVSKSPKNQLKKSRNKRLAGSQTQVASKRRSSKQKSSREHDTYGKNTMQDWQKFKMPVNRSQFKTFSPKTMMKTSSVGISDFGKYQMMTKPSKHSEVRAPADKRVTSYINSLASDGSKSKEDLRFVPVENISLFDDSSAPLSARNPRISSGLSTHQHLNVGTELYKINFMRNFRLIKVFKNWASVTRRQKYLERRAKLAQKLPWGKQFFTHLISSAIVPLNEIRY